MRRQGGQSLILYAILGVVIFAFVAFAVDVGRLYAAGNQLSETAGVASLAGSQKLNLAPGTDPTCAGLTSPGSGEDAAWQAALNTLKDNGYQPPAKEFTAPKPCSVATNLPANVTSAIAVGPFTLNKNPATQTTIYLYLQDGTITQNFQVDLSAPFSYTFARVVGLTGTVLTRNADNGSYVGLGPDVCQLGQCNNNPPPPKKSQPPTCSTCAVTPVGIDYQMMQGMQGMQGMMEAMGQGQQVTMTLAPAAAGSYQGSLSWSGASSNPNVSPSSGSGNWYRLNLATESNPTDANVNAWEGYRGGRYTGNDAAMRGMMGNNYGGSSCSVNTCNPMGGMGNSQMCNGNMGGGGGGGGNMGGGGGGSMGGGGGGGGGGSGGGGTAGTGTSSGQQGSYSTYFNTLYGYPGNVQVGDTMQGQLANGYGYMAGMMDNRYNVGTVTGCSTCATDNTPAYVLMPVMQDMGNGTLQVMGLAYGQLTSVGSNGDMHFNMRMMTHQKRYSSQCLQYNYQPGQQMPSGMNSNTGVRSAPFPRKPVAFQGS